LPDGQEGDDENDPDEQRLVRLLHLVTLHSGTSEDLRTSLYFATAMLVRI
jgi:hypothetical protein